MKKHTIIYAVSLTVLALCSVPSQAAVFSKDNVGTTSAQFLKLGVGARPVAMGEAFAGLADDVNAIYWNPAGLNLVEGRQVSAMHAIWFEDISFSWLAYTQDALKGKLGLGINYLTAGDMDSYDNTGADLSETYTAYDMAATISYARIYKNIPLGMNLKLINSKLEDETAFGVAADIAMLKTLSEEKDIKLGVVIQNLGMGLKYIDEADPLPLNIKMGSYYRFFNDKLTVLADVNFPIDNNPNAHLGAEYVYCVGSVKLIPRTGFKTTTISDMDAISGLSGGIGIEYSSIVIDYAWVPYWEFGSTHRVSASYRFGSKTSPMTSVKKKVSKKVFKAKKSVVKKVKKQKKGKADKLYEKGCKYMKKDQYLKALEVFSEVLTMDPKNSKALKKLEEANKKLK